MLNPSRVFMGRRAQKIVPEIPTRKQVWQQTPGNKKAPVIGLLQRKLRLVLAAAQSPGTWQQGRDAPGMDMEMPQQASRTLYPSHSMLLDRACQTDKTFLPAHFNCVFPSFRIQGSPSMPGGNEQIAARTMLWSKGSDSSCWCCG